MITVLLASPALDITYLVDAVEEGAIHRPREVLRLPGGKGLNLARAAARLGAECRVVAPLGGHTGALVAELAEEQKVRVEAVPVAGETRSCVTVAADDDGQLTEFYEHSAPLAAGEVAALLRAFADAPLGGWTALSGSVPRDVPADELVQALRRRRAAGERVAVDTHGPALAALVDVLHPELVKVNRAEAIELLGETGTARDLAARLQARTGGAVVITDGEHGSAAVDAAGAWIVPAPASRGRYAVGSGDTFLGGLLVGLERGDALDAALALAAAAAGANAEVPGGAVFSSDAVAERLATTQVERAA